ncbi:MAG: hypothetical protein ACK5GN_10715, partial [Pseudomonadota bacterium]
VQKSVPVKLARLLLDITIGCCFDSHPRIDSVLQNSGFRYGLLENAICLQNPLVIRLSCKIALNYSSLVRVAALFSTSLRQLCLEGDSPAF